MKSVTKAKVKRVPRIDPTKYNQFFSHLPVEFSKGDKNRTKRRFYIREDEFNLLQPRLIAEKIIGWTKFPVGKEEESEAIIVKIYITDGTRTIADDKKINTAYSYFVRYGDLTYKPWDLEQCFQIVNGIRLELIEDLYKTIERDKKQRDK